LSEKSIGGVMICPFLKEECKKGECAIWVELFMGDPKDNKKEGKCGFAWQSILQIETTQAIKEKK